MPGFDRGERQVERHGGRGRGEDVVRVRTPDQRRAHVQRAARRADLEGEPVEREGERPGPDVGGRIDGVGDRTARRRDQIRAARDRRR